MLGFISKIYEPVLVHQGGLWCPLVLMVHPDPPWTRFSVKFEKVWIRIDRSQPGGPGGRQPPLVDQERSGPAWTMLRHFPDTWFR